MIVRGGCPGAAARWVVLACDVAIPLGILKAVHF